MNMLPYEKNSDRIFWNEEEPLRWTWFIGLGTINIRHYRTISFLEEALCLAFVHVLSWWCWWCRRNRKSYYSDSHSTMLGVSVICVNLSYPYAALLSVQSLRLVSGSAATHTTIFEHWFIFADFCILINSKCNKYAIPKNRNHSWGAKRLRRDSWKKYVKKENYAVLVMGLWFTIFFVWLASWY